MARERHERRRILANPDEPKTGDYAFGLYDKAHPIKGKPETIKAIKRELRGYRGEWVTMYAYGMREDAETGDEKRFKFKHTFLYRKYSDVFGPGSAYGAIVHAVRDKYSEDALTTFHLDIEFADPADIPEL